MVMFTVNDAALTYSLSDTPTVSDVITRAGAAGATDYLFTSTNIYNASMFAVEGSQGWLGALFYGRTTVDSDGSIGFIPDAQIEGSISGISVDAFAVDYVTSHGSSKGLRVALFSGDDTLIGNKSGGALQGWAGNDLLVGNAYSKGDALNGGSGDDVIHPVARSNRFPSYVIGDDGSDFIFMSDARVIGSGGTGADTFLYLHIPGRRFNDQITGFSAEDRFQLDPTAFTALSSGFAETNFVLGPKAQDSDDFVIFDGRQLFYDPDGSGVQRQIPLADLVASAPVTWQNIFVSASVPVAGDLGTVPPTQDHPNHAFALHATGLLP